jgi:putative intracellular protease/amidase
VAIPGGRHLAATFADVPDVPIRRFVLRFHAGARGVVGLAHGLCRLNTSARAHVLIVGHAALAATARPPLAVRGCNSGRLSYAPRRGNRITVRPHVESR